MKKRRLCKWATLSTETPVAEPATFEKETKEGSGNEAAPIIISGTEEETSAHILCECEALASLRHAHLGSFSWTLRLL